MKKVIVLFFISLIVFLSASCGVKGPLYFPEKDQSQEQ